MHRAHRTYLMKNIKDEKMEEKNTNREYMINSRGEKVHIDLIKGDELMRDTLVNNLLADAEVFRNMLGEFRAKSEARVEEYMNTLMGKYRINAMARSKKGNITLENFAGTAKIQIAVQDTLAFDEKIQLAKMKFDEYFEQVTEGSSEEIKLLINKAFDVDKEGNVDVKKILELRSYNIRHPKWVEGVALIEEAKKIVYSKRFIRFYRRNDPTNKWEHVSLDLAAV